MIAIHPDHTSKVDPVARILDEPVSASRLNLFHSCRLKFYFRYVLKISKPTSPALHVGKTVHAMLQEWSKRRWMGKPASSENLLEPFNEHWRSSLLDDPVAFEENEAEDAKAKAWALVEMYLRDTPIPLDEKPMGVEVSVERDLSEHGLPSLRGVIDLVRADGRIVDFKTSATTPNLEQVLHRNEVQLTAYGLLYREATGERETGFELHHLVKTKVPKLVVTKHRSVSEVQQNKLFHSMESYVSGVQREDWVPSPGLQCVSCEFFNECSGGAAL
jgi:CRISPR/Cas system-associated exonuclease Cas4 (RecB family)